MRTVLLLLSLLLLLGGCIEEPDKKPTKKTPVHYYLNTQYTYPTGVDQSILTTGLDSAYLLIANKQTALGPDYEPPNLTEIPASLRVSKTMYLEGRTLQALTLMMQEMRAAGINDTLVTSAYRTYEYQSRLFNDYLILETSRLTSDAYAYFGNEYIYRNYTSQGKTGLSWADAEKVVLSYSAYPGTSEHQSGLCVDFITSSMSGLTVEFENTEAFRWLSQNAYRYGFILRYPNGKQDVVGYSYEPWHYRFVGREAATDIYFGNLTLEEYVAALN